MRPGLRWVAIPVVGVAIALWSVATMAGLYSVGTSLAAASNGLPQGLLAPRTIALADPRRAANFVHEGKMARIKPLAQPDIVPPAAEISPQARFDGVVAKAALSPEKLAAAFATAAPPMLASRPAAARFAEPVRLPDQNGPAPARFGPEVAEIERSSRLALTLANALPEGMVDVLPPAVAAGGPAAPQEQQGEAQMASLPPQDEIPESIPLPTWRPQAEIDQPAEAPKVTSPKVPSPKAQPTKAQAAKTKPARRSKAQAADMLAYAKPDSPAGGVGEAFRNLFTTPGSGVAVYDISAKTVYMPDGSRLEAHSGKGSMVDQPRYANRKNGGPTPPHTYDLRLRESRFHGVEALRLTPIDGKNKYGRDGFLAHTYLLRGGRAESNGCVVFKDYARFLAAFKKGKIKRLVVRG